MIPTDAKPSYHACSPAKRGYNDIQLLGQWLWFITDMQVARNRISELA
jgi:hypothetical protein